jgi:hypothetical protein
MTDQPTGVPSDEELSSLVEAGAHRHADGYHYVPVTHVHALVREVRDRTLATKEAEITDLSLCYLALPNLFKDVGLGDDEKITKMRATVLHFSQCFLKYEEGHKQLEADELRKSAEDNIAALKGDAEILWNRIGNLEQWGKVDKKRITELEAELKSTRVKALREAADKVKAVGTRGGMTTYIEDLLRRAADEAEKESTNG